MIKNIIYDLDGTLINSSEDIINSFNFALEKNNIKTRVDERFFLKNANLGSKFFIKKAVKKNKANISKIQKDFQKHYEINFYKNTSLKVGARQFLKFTKKNSFVNILCTNKKEQTAIKILKKYQVYDYFKFIIGYDTFNEKKPEFKFIKKIFRELKLKNSNTIMIGDTEIDSLLAKRAKIIFFLIKNGYTSKKNFFYNFKFNDFNEIKNKINEQV